ncbi:MAG: hypothetical protein ACJ761_10495 [Chloroflexota bacterium]
MDWLQFGVQWLHVFLGIFWFGAVLYADFILIPAINTLPLGKQREFGSAVGARAARIIPAIAAGVILLGIVRGTLFGPVKSLDFLLTTAYGLTWLVALVAAVSTFTWAKLQIEPAIARLVNVPDAEALTPDGQPTPKLEAIVADVKRKTLLELVGFFVIFTCMILMRFGY